MSAPLPDCATVSKTPIWRFFARAEIYYSKESDGVKQWTSMERILEKIYDAEKLNPLQLLTEVMAKIAKEHKLGSTTDPEVFVKYFTLDPYVEILYDKWRGWKNGNTDGAIISQKLAEFGIMTYVFSRKDTVPYLLLVIPPFIALSWDDYYTEEIIGKEAMKRVKVSNSRVNITAVSSDPARYIKSYETASTVLTKALAERKLQGSKAERDPWVTFDIDGRDVAFYTKAYDMVDEKPSMWIAVVIDDSNKLPVNDSDVDKNLKLNVAYLMAESLVQAWREKCPVRVSQKRFDNKTIVNENSKKLASLATGYVNADVSKTEEPLGHQIDYPTGYQSGYNKQVSNKLRVLYLEPIPVGQPTLDWSGAYKQRADRMTPFKMEDMPEAVKKSLECVQGTCVIDKMNIARGPMIPGYKPALGGPVMLDCNNTEDEAEIMRLARELKLEMSDNQDFLQTCMQVKSKLEDLIPK